VINIYIGSGYPVVLCGSCFWCVCVCVCARAVLLLLCPLYKPVGVVLLRILCGFVVFLVVVHHIFCYIDILSWHRSLLLKVTICNIENIWV
jgi:hypothetical protein